MYLIPGVTAIALAAAVALVSGPESRSHVVAGRGRIAVTVAATVVAIAGTVDDRSPGPFAPCAGVRPARARPRRSPGRWRRGDAPRSNTTPTRCRRSSCGRRSSPRLTTSRRRSPTQTGDRDRAAQLDYVGAGRRSAHPPRRPCREREPRMRARLPWTRSSPTSRARCPLRRRLRDVDRRAYTQGKDERPLRWRGCYRYGRDLGSSRGRPQRRAWRVGRTPGVPPVRSTASHFRSCGARGPDIHLSGDEAPPLLGSGSHP